MKYDSSEEKSTPPKPFSLGFNPHLVESTTDKGKNDSKNEKVRLESGIPKSTSSNQRNKRKLIFSSKLKDSKESKERSYPKVKNIPVESPKHPSNESSSKLSGTLTTEEEESGIGTGVISFYSPEEYIERNKNKSGLYGLGENYQELDNSQQIELTKDALRRAGISSLEDTIQNS